MEVRGRYYQATTLIRAVLETCKFILTMSRMDNENLHIGTCSWKYDSWEGIVYSHKKLDNYLAEYSQHFNTVEVDQWFWSLFAGDRAVLPKLSVVKEYAESVPDDFVFSIKIPNSITLTHHYKKHKSDRLLPNPHFLSSELMSRFLGLQFASGLTSGFSAITKTIICHACPRFFICFFSHLVAVLENRSHI